MRQYNFGSPLCGNAAFVEEYGRRVPDSWRVKTPYDLVSNIPPAGRYQHLKQALVLLPDGHVHVPSRDLVETIELQLLPGGPSSEQVCL